MDIPGKLCKFGIAIIYPAFDFQGAGNHVFSFGHNSMGCQAIRVEGAGD
jgi:hypothetical protein